MKIRWIAAAALALSGSVAQAAEYRWLNSWDRTLPQIPMFVEPYLKAVEAASKGSIKFRVSGPEAVPPFEQLQPVASGAFHFLFTHGAYHFGTSPLLVKPIEIVNSQVVGDAGQELVEFTVRANINRPPVPGAPARGRGAAGRQGGAS